MSYDAEGTLYKKYDVAQVTDSFKKREFILKIEDGMYPQVVKFQLTQNNCEKLDPFNEGDQIKVTFSLRGREYEKEGKVSFFTNLDAWRIDKAGTAAAASAPAAAAAFPTEEPSTTSTSAPDASANDDLPF